MLSMLGVECKLGGVVCVGTMEGNVLYAANSIEQVEMPQK